MITAGIYGGSGYMGGEVIRILLDHPETEIVWITSRGDKPVEYFHRNLTGRGLVFVKPEQTSKCDVVFTALPSGHIMRMASSLLADGTKIIDLGADFRLKNRDDWERTYGMKHENWDLVAEAVYGITELHRDEIKKARIVANPGCYSSASILGLAPLVKNNIIDTEHIIIDGLSGTTGAGAEPDMPSHHPEIANNIVPYNVIDHRHTYEIEQELQNLSDSRAIVHFTSCYVPITRGILAICHCFPEKSISRNELIELFRQFYTGHPFINIVDMPKEKNVSWQYLPYPWVAAVSGSNYCHIGLDIDEKRNRIVVFSVLDSIGKGGAQVGVQNMNLLFNLPEETGLQRTGLHPY
ncbi:MAG: N-acetyl-gamma-glutamyl-phosphate reductase [Spirochaetales bacterium]|nr:N-acetyl-gamma-glutamyl-phosphate reductase [Spirochaetales bacterium]